MSYPDGEALVLTRLRALSDFDADNTGRGKWSLLSSGASQYYAIVKAGERNFSRMGLGGQQEAAESTIVQLWYRYKEPGTTYTNLISLVETVRQELDRYPHIGQSAPSIRGARVVQVREIEEMWKKNGGLEWLRADVVLRWDEDEAVSLQE